MYARLCECVRARLCERISACLHDCVSAHLCERVQLCTSLPERVPVVPNLHERLRVFTNLPERLHDKSMPYASVCASLPVRVACVCMSK